MKQFNLEEYKLHPDIPLITRDGHKARIICTDCLDSCDDDDNQRSVIALVRYNNDTDECVHRYTADGRISCCAEPNDYDDDLFFAVEPMTKYVNVFYNPTADLIFSDSRVFDTYEEAYDDAKGCRYYSSTNKITYYK